ncbi:MAG: hypothetical protein N2439_01260, partial [Anaerolineae bacterium]|nr:hypothetical protein [Anaerolineae bacterium]
SSAASDVYKRQALSGIAATGPFTLTAWAPGHYVGWTALNPRAADWTGRPVTITLKLLPEKDNADYDWFSFEGVQGTASCGLCHREYAEWLKDAHSQSAKNPRFISIYTGDDVHGRPNQPVRWGEGGKALPPDPGKPYYGPGFKLDNPGRAGNCATCHTPVASKVPNRQNCGWSGCHTDLTIERSRGVIDPATSPLVSTGAGAEGITCDFCHKIGDVILDPHTRLPPPDMPGILSYRLYRPQEGQQIFFGTVLDVTRRVSYLPLQAKSEYCAPCHYGVFGGVVGVGTVTGGTVIYNSYGEWLESPYSDPVHGKTCQDCHMPPSDARYFVFPERGGIARDYVTLHNHTMPGASDETLLQNSVTMTATARHAENRLQVEVSITNDKTGHHIPTDVPIRSMMLIVEAVDAGGKPLPLVQGPVNPTWAGDDAGKPGKTFAKVLRDEWTGETPTAAYWRPITVVEDSRLPALATDTTRYVFDLPAGQAARVRVRLIFRRAFQALAQQKGWTDPDILMEEATIVVAP